MSHAPFIDSISRPLVRIFGALFAEPERWFSVPELVAASGAARATIYRRCGNLAAARVIRRRRVADQVQFALSAAWDETVLGRQLHARATSRSPASREDRP